MDLSESWGDSPYLTGSSREALEGPASPDPPDPAREPWTFTSSPRRRGPSARHLPSWGASLKIRYDHHLVHHLGVLGAGNVRLLGQRCATGARAEAPPPPRPRRSRPELTTTG